MAEFKFSCPKCRQHIQCDANYSGMQIDCPLCKKSVVVPQEPRAAAPPVPAKSQTLRNVIVIAGLLVVLAGLVVVVRFGYVKIRTQFKRGHFPPGLVSLWSGEDNAIDSIGGNNGKLTGKVTYRKGRIGQAFVFDGGKEWVDLGNPASLQLQDFTIATWIKRANTSYVSDNNHNAMIFCHGVGGYGLYLNPSGRPVMSKIGISGPASDKAITDTGWHHLAVTKSGNTVVFYVDGVAYPAPAYTVKFAFSKNAFIGGKDQKYWECTFAGLIDEVGVYNRALSDSEIQAIYKE
jgi:hypothetical protein